MPVNVDRPLLPLEHQQLREHMPETNRLGDLSIKWRRLGEAAVTLVQRAEYDKLTAMERSVLRSENPESVAARLKADVLPTLSLGSERLSAKIYDIEFFGSSRFLSIAYMLDSPELEDERDAVTAALDRMNGVNARWREYRPHLTVATVERVNASKAVLDAFYRFAPKEITLLPPRSIAR
ncbi:MAG: hypothetical protein JWN33_25 [Candidatus Saccharibacteria bacterium]|nr:hypothetical protein [Candidatus Saccharibacteria bacterium]